jgi:cobalamin biosynthesis protein CobT
MRSTRVHHFAFDDDDDDDEKNKNDENDENDKNDEDDENDKNDENDHVEDDEKQTTRRKEFVEILEENRSVFEKKTFDVSFDFESSRDQNDVDVKSKESEKNADEKSADEKRISSSNSFNSFSEFFNFDEREIASSITSFQRRVVSKTTFDSKSTFDFRRSFRRSSKTSFEKKKRSIFSERNVESSLKRRRRRSKF